MISKWLILVSAFVATVLAVPATTATEQTLTIRGDAPVEMSESLRREAEAAIHRGKEWLLKTQHEDGHWSNPAFPALTALPLWALVIGEGSPDDDAVQRAVDFLLKSVNPDGSIFNQPREERRGGGLSTYNTAISMTALHLTGKPELVAVVQNAREFLAKSQHLGDDIYYGGMGYDAATDRPYADLSNSVIAYEAMRLTEGVEDFRDAGEERVDLDWNAALAFIQRVHNDPRFNDQPWVNPDPDERGGFAYHPEQTRAGTMEDADGIIRFRSMPGMTYAGMLSYIYAGVDRDDPRVQATVEWAIRHWNLDTAARIPENNDHADEIASREKKEGLFYFYNVLSKGLATYGQDVLAPENGEAFNWRIDLIKQLLSRQRIDTDGTGYWVNDVSRYWESDRVLVTAYTLIALHIALGGS